MPTLEQIDEWLKVHTFQIVKSWLGSIAQAHVECLLFLWNIKRPKHPIPDGQCKAKIMTKVPCLSAVMNLMLRWANEDVTQY